MRGADHESVQLLLLDPDNTERCLGLVDRDRRVRGMRLQNACAWPDGRKAPPVENFAWLPVGVNSDKPARGSVSLV